MRKYLQVLLCGVLCICMPVLAGCGAAQYTEDEVAEIVDAALTQGEIANLLYLGEFDSDYSEYIETDEGLFELVMPEEQTLPFPVEVDLLALVAELQSIEDIRTCLQDAFVPHLAEAYLADMFSPGGDTYRMEGGLLYQNVSMVLATLSLIVWEHQPQSIIENTPDRLVVELRGTFMLTGNMQILPLTLTRQNDTLAAG